MNEISIIPPQYYSSFYLLLICVLCCLTTSLYYGFSSYSSIIEQRSISSSFYSSLLLIVFVTLFLGLRPAIHPAFADSQTYGMMYFIVDEINTINWSEEWLWNRIIIFCREFLHFNVNEYFLFLECCYTLTMLVACVKLFKYNIWIPILFILSSFSFYGYAVNGLRNGIACHITLLGLILMADRKSINYFIALLFFILAYAIHRSIVLPCICLVLSLFLNNTKFALWFWGLSIIFSYIFGNIVGNLFQGIGIFEDKLSYFQDLEKTDLVNSFSRTGFRFDFLLYSAMPILMVWYVTVKRNFHDFTYNIIANTYILANAFWILVIRASFSNRFAYLSWFLYPLVIAYPLVRMRIWDEQDRKAALILLAYSGFTFFMHFVYYA